MDGFHIGLESMSSRRNGAVYKLGGFDRESIRGRILRRPRAYILRAIIGLADAIFDDKIVFFKMLIDLSGE
jgi:hypothetical protein